MNKIVILPFLTGLFLLIFQPTQAQEAMVLNPNDTKCVVRAYTKMGGVRGDIKTVVISVDNGQKYRYEYNYKKQRGYNGVKCNWEGDVMKIAKEACQKGQSLESHGFKPYY
ncbi:MAG: hypothetical protein NZ551_10060 [Microscillaceae bacterium]|nr:hypothetical protein [Microscillaceae bacterium]MDW8461540.1 hypothetical protein [Cytophagales bacterium]